MFQNQVVEMGGVQTLIFLSQSGNDEVKVSCVVAFENLKNQFFFFGTSPEHLFGFDVEYLCS